MIPLESIDKMHVFELSINYLRKYIQRKITFIKALRKTKSSCTCENDYNLQYDLKSVIFSSYIKL